MMSKPVLVKESAAEYASEIFGAKREFRKDLSRLPIEEKIEILIELQKIVTSTRKKSPDDPLRRVWDI